MMIKGTISPFTPWGTKIRYTGKNGYEINHENAKKAGMKIGDVYTLRETCIGGSYTSITLKEISGDWNSVMFEYADPDEFRERIIREFGLDPSSHPGNISRNKLLSYIDKRIAEETQLKDDHYNAGYDVSHLKFIGGKIRTFKEIRDYIKKH